MSTKPYFPPAGGEYVAKADIPVGPSTHPEDDGRVPPWPYIYWKWTAAAILMPGKCWGATKPAPPFNTNCLCALRKAAIEDCRMKSFASFSSQIGITKSPTRKVAPHLALSGCRLNDGDKIRRLERSPSDEAAVHIRLCQQLLRVGSVHGASVLDGE